VIIRIYTMCMTGASARLTTQRRHKDDEENDGLDGRAQDLGLTNRSILMRFGQLSLGQRGDENGTDTHGTEPTGESGLSERLDVGDPAVGSEHEWQASKQKNSDGQEKKPPYGDLQAIDWSACAVLKPKHLTYRSRGIVPIGKRNDHSDIDETGTVEQQIDNVGKHAILGGLVEEPAARLRYGQSTCHDGVQRDATLTPKRKRFHKQTRRASHHFQVMCIHLGIQHSQTFRFHHYAW
jgi:hypothetical protein